MSDDDLHILIAETLEVAADLLAEMEARCDAVSYHAWHVIVDTVREQVLTKG